MLIDGLGTWIAVLHRAGAFGRHGAAPIATTVGADIDRLVGAAAQRRAVIVVAEEAGRGCCPRPGLARLARPARGRPPAPRRCAPIGWTSSWPGARSTLAGGAPRPSRPGLRHHGDRDVRPGDADHAVNVVAGGPPRWLREALHAALDVDADRYPASEA